MHDQTGLLDREHEGVFCWRTTLESSDFIPQPTEVAELCWRPVDVVLRELQAAVSTLRYTPPREAYRQMLVWAVL